MSIWVYTCTCSLHNASGPRFWHLGGGCVSAWDARRWEWSECWVSTTSAHGNGHQEPLLPWASLIFRIRGLGISLLSFSLLKLEVVSIIIIIFNLTTRGLWARMWRQQGCCSRRDWMSGDPFQLCGWDLLSTKVSLHAENPVQKYPRVWLWLTGIGYAGLMVHRTYAHGSHWLVHVHFKGNKFAYLLRLRDILRFLALWC